jgi:glucose/arabinose dehydrogenase
MRGTLLQAVLLVSLGAACTSPPADAQGAERPFKTTEVATFDAPWAMDFLPGSGVPLTNLALVSERGGKLWLLDARTGRKQPVGGLPAVAVAGQGGLGDVVAHPDFAGNQRIYLSFAEPGPDGTSGAAVGYGRLLIGQGPPRIEGFKVIWRQSPKVSGDGHFAHRIAFAPDGSLFVTSGDRQKMTPAQEMSGNLGKVVHLTAEGANAAGNPWASRGGIGASFWTIGHRNPLGIAFAPDGRLWVSEMGPKGGDELNLIEAGRNYGWPAASNGSNYDSSGIPDHKPGDGFEPPKAYWTPSISPGSLLIYSGDLFPAWKGDALLGALSGEALIRVDVNGATATKADQWPMGARIRAVDQGPRGEIYLLQDGDGAKLLRLEPA